MLLLDYLRSTEVYRALTANDLNSEGNLLQITDDRTSEAQIELIRYAVALADPRNIL